MKELIEEARTSRATCRICRQKIEKGDLRFGEDEVSAFSQNGVATTRWYHLRCAALARPKKLKPLLAAWDGDLPERAQLETAIDEALKKARPQAPYAEPSPNARARCLACSESVDLGALRIAIERDVDTGSFVTRSIGFLHPGCAAGYVGDSKGFLKSVLANSNGLTAGQTAELKTAMT